MPQPPEQERYVEILMFPFMQASRFDSKEASQALYDRIQQLLRDRPDTDFSVFRLIQNWPETMSKAPPSQKRWYVAVLGETPPEPVAMQVTEAINEREPVPLPDEVIAMLAEKRMRETAQ